MPVVGFPLNQLFTGPPGTWKTTCAKLYGEILRDLGFLSSGEVLTASPSSFMEAVVGGSRKKTAEILEKAMVRLKRRSQVSRARVHPVRPLSVTTQAS